VQGGDLGGTLAGGGAGDDDQAVLDPVAHREGAGTGDVDSGMCAR
jgi:hypothetical protein